MPPLENDTQDASSFTLTIGVLRINPKKVFRSSLALPVLIILTVFIFNLPYLFADLLWHDDGYCYYMASGGQLPFGTALRAQICTLAPYLDGFYSYGMVHLGLPLIRGIFVLVMALSSLFLYLFYRDSFGLDFRVALLAAVIPNILPSLKGIPVGLNASYAMWGLLPIVISLLLLTHAFNKRGIYSWLLAGFAFTFYYLGLNLAPSSNFLIPCVLYFLIMFFPSQKIKSLIFFFPFLGLGGWQLYKQFLHSHKDPATIPLTEIASRVRQFFEMSDFLAFNSSLSIYLTLALILFGIAGLLPANSKLYTKPDHFNYSSGLNRILLIGWPLCWMGANSLAYVAASPTFRPYDYAYIFNFGTILLQASGIVYLVIILFAPFRISISKTVILGSVVTLIILTAGIQRIYYRYDSWGWKTSVEKTVGLMRKTLSEIKVPPQAQIVIFGIGTAHSGTYVFNSGALRYLLDRNDISGLIGPDMYPNDVFAEAKGWTDDQMFGLDKEKPIIVFRNNKGTLERVTFLLQVVSTGSKELPRFKWTLFNLKNGTEKPEEMAHGLGISSYIEYLDTNLPPELRHVDIAFAPKENPSIFLGKETADKFPTGKNLLHTRLNFGNNLTLQSVSVNTNQKTQFLEMLLRVNSLPEGKFRLGYTVNGKVEYVKLWDYVMEGDCILIRTPSIPRKTLEKGVELGIINAWGWPHKPISIQGGPDSGKQKFSVSLSPSD